MSKLLNQNELRDKVSRITDYLVEMGEAEEGQDGWYVTYDKKLEEILNLIQSQKIAHADMVIGEDEMHTKKCKEYSNSQQIDKFCICNARQNNALRSEQRGRNKVDE